MEVVTAVPGVVAEYTSCDRVTTTGAMLRDREQSDPV